MRSLCICSFVARFSSQDTSSILRLLVTANAPILPGPRQPFHIIRRMPLRSLVRKGVENCGLFRHALILSTARPTG